MFERKITKCVAATIPHFIANSAMLHHLASQIAARLLTYSIDVRRELSLSKYNCYICDTEYNIMHEPIMTSYESITVP